jgi:hypothetical protein
MAQICDQLAKRLEHKNPAVLTKALKVRTPFPISRSAKHAGYCQHCLLNVTV